jgi:hypothetical protein
MVLFVVKPLLLKADFINMKNNTINVGIGTVVLSDGSKTYNVGITNEDGQYTRLECLDEKHALKMQADVIKTLQKNGV